MVARTDAEAPAVKEEIPHDHLFKVTGLSSSNLEKLAQEPSADFEEAIAATCYGKFNILLLLATLPAFWSAVSVTSSVSYIFTRAQCDMMLSLVDMGTVTAITYAGPCPVVYVFLATLPAFWSAVSVTSSVSYIFTRSQCDMMLSLVDMGTVTAITYAGMISSAMIWGFLSDTLGRKRIMVWGFFCTGLVEMAMACSQTFAMLLVTRFMSGFLFNGPFAVLISYLAELHRTELRARMILLTSLFYTIANTTLPLLAWGILTKDIHFYIFGEKFVIHSWNLFLLSTSLVPLLTGLAFSLLPESPKFLMSRGRNQEALEVFRKIYAMNTGKRRDEFPITRLTEEKNTQQARGVAALRAGWSQMAPLFRIPHGPWLLLMCTIHLGAMFGTNTLRLWYPQLAAMIGSGSNTTLCAAIEPSAAPILEEIPCVPIETDMMTYLQSAVVGAGSVLTYGIGGVIINRCGKKLVAGACALASAGCIALLPLLGTSAGAVLALVTSALALTALFGSSLQSINVEMFPTSLRVMAVATFLMSGRIGTITGTVAFPALIDFGCYPPFIAIAAVLAAVGLASFVLPNTTLKKLE